MIDPNTHHKMATNLILRMIEQGSNVLTEKGSIMRIKNDDGIITGMGVFNSSGQKIFETIHTDKAVDLFISVVGVFTAIGCGVNYFRHQKDKCRVINV